MLDPKLQSPRCYVFKEFVCVFHPEFEAPQKVVP